MATISEQRQARRSRRLSVLRDMEEAIELEGHWEECDRCHEEKRVVMDPDTLCEGEFVMCRLCIRLAIAGIPD